MIKNIILAVSIILLNPLGLKAQTPNNCNGAVSGCTTPSFTIDPSDPLTDIVDFTSGSISNPGTNPNGTNSGCLITGETSSTFITISVMTTGTLAWSIQGPVAFGCFDWIMWPYNGLTTCAAITGNTLPPVSCNWNGSCNSFSGMAPPGGLPPGANASNFESAINVTAGETYLLCLSNFSSTSQNVNLNFFGTAQVACEPSAPNQTICLGTSANVTIATPGLINPTFNWLVTNGVSNPTGGTNVTVTPTVTTTYQVQVTSVGSATALPFNEVISFTITVVTPPMPNAGIDQTICLGQTVSLAGVKSLASNTSSWTKIVPAGLAPPATANFSPNSISLTPVVTVNQPGTYKFVLNEVNATCGTVRDTMVVTVSSLNQTVNTVNPSCGGSADGEITISSPTATTFSFDNGVTWQASPTKNGLSAGTYLVCSRNALGCQKCSSVTLIDPPAVTLIASNDTVICQNGTATLMAQGGNGVSFTYQWGHTPDQASTQLVSPLANTNYTVVATNELGCSSLPETIMVSVRAPISGSLSQNVAVCPNYLDSLTVFANGGIGLPYTFTWSTGENHLGDTSKIIVQPSISTTYSVTITDACESTPLVLTSQVVVYPAPIPMFSVVDNSICEPAVFELTNLTDLANVAQTVWNISDGQSYLNSNVVLTDSMYKGSYHVQMIVTSQDGCIDSLTKNNFITSNPIPIVNFKWNPMPITMFNTNVLFLNETVYGNSYNWIFEGASLSNSSEENPRIRYPEGEEGAYSVSLVATSIHGCVDSISRLVTVNSEVILYAPNAFTPDGNEYNQTWKVFMDGIDIYDFHLKIFNRWGALVWESRDIEAGWDGTYDGEIIQDGAYVWTIDVLDQYSDKKYNFNGHVSIIR